MTFELLKRYKNGIYFIDIRLWKLGFWWFTDCGDWFIYFKFGKRHYRFSNTGYMKFDQEDPKERLKQALKEVKLMREGKLPKKPWEELKQELKD